MFGVRKAVRIDDTSLAPQSLSSAHGLGRAVARAACAAAPKMSRPVNSLSSDSSFRFASIDLSPEVGRFGISLPIPPRRHDLFRRSILKRECSYVANVLLRREPL